jgi:hypothetical protein
MLGIVFQERLLAMLLLRIQQQAEDFVNDLQMLKTQVHSDE